MNTGSELAPAPKTAIVGGGISGLSLAFWLKRGGHDVTLFEARDRSGGYAGSICEEGFLVETGPNSLLRNDPAMEQIIADLKLESQTLDASKASRSRFVFFKGQLHKIPLSPTTLIRSPLLTARAKWRLLGEVFVRRPQRSRVNKTSESVFDFMARHFGSEFAEVLARPMIVGVFAGDARELAVDAAFSRLKDLENKSGSLIRAQLSGIFSKSGPRLKLFTFKRGIQQLVDALTSELKENIRLQTPVVSLERSTTPGPTTWNLRVGAPRASTSDNAHVASSPERFDRVVLAGSWQEVLRLTAPLRPAMIETPLEPQDVAPVVSLSFAIKGPSPLEGFGALVHPKENLHTLGVLAPSEIFTGRAPEGHSLLTLIMGGVFHPKFAQAPPEGPTDEQIVEIALRDLEKIFGRKIQPTRHWLKRWPQGITQYRIKNMSRLTELKSSIEAQPELYLHSHAFGGVSVNDCLRKSLALSKRLSSGLQPAKIDP